MTKLEKATTLLLKSTTLPFFIDKTKPVDCIKYIADQAQNRTSDNKVNSEGDYLSSYRDTVRVFGKKLVDSCILCYPISEDTQLTKAQLEIIEAITFALSNQFNGKLAGQSSKEIYHTFIQNKLKNEK